MGRIMGIDYGRKRVGIAVTDPIKIIASGLTTVHSKDIFDFLKTYFNKESVDAVAIGYPKTLSNQPAEALIYVNPFIKKFKKEFPEIPVHLIDERFTSKMAFQTMIDGGLKKKARRNKELVDSISAAIILQSFMEQRH
ncbi:MAG: Holliday junction resolvase RuvX [Bacteroidota bacterium]|nr:Holliday junction resolvase RuvX [Bacteroidota bacterium]